MVAHEITHGITYYTSYLIYENESGALNEGMSDVFAAVVERIKGKKRIASVWTNGEDITLSGAGVRSMVSLPTCR